MLLITNQITVFINFEYSMTSKIGTPNIDKILSEKDYKHHLDIINARREIMEANSKLDKLVQSCDHKLIPLTPNQIKLLEEDDVESWDYSDSRCMICDQYFGWRCTNSPDGACHYHTNSDDDLHGPFYVKLINGERYKLENYDYSNKVNETSDSCIFCHKPDERL